jgi:hypothetical protein
MNSDRSRLGIGLLTSAALGASALTLGSCQSTASYVADHSEGYVITKGEVVKVEHLQAPSLRTLDDGAVWTIGDHPAQVTMRLGDHEESLTLEAGDQLVQGDGGDFVLLLR